MQDIPEWIIWVGVGLCLSQSAMFSGLNLALFSIGQHRLETEVAHGNQAASRILRLRKDTNFLLCTILWGNVSVNVLLALLMDSALPGILGFVISTFGITFFGEIVPQAYFSRNAIRIGSKLAPLVYFYKVLLYPVAKPSSIVLDGWIGKEGPIFYRERDFETILEKHIREADSEIGATEGRGALNFLDLDDRLISEEGTKILPSTVYSFETNMDLPVLPEIGTPEAEVLIQSLKAHPDKWAIITDERDEPRIVLESEAYLYEHFGADAEADPYDFCHRPVVIKDPAATLDTVLDKFVVEAEHREDNIVDRDVIVYWGPGDRRIVTGADILGRLLQGIAKRERMPDAPVTDQLLSDVPDGGEGGGEGDGLGADSASESGGGVHAPAPTGHL